MAWGVFVGHEPMPVGRWLGFALIWLALLVFTGDALLRARRTAQQSPRPVEEEKVCDCRALAPPSGWTPPSTGGDHRKEKQMEHAMFYRTGR